MRIAISGLTISSSWGNGHATLWRGLCKAQLEELFVNSVHTSEQRARTLLGYFEEFRSPVQLPLARTFNDVPAEVRA